MSLVFIIKFEKKNFETRRNFYKNMGPYSQHTQENVWAKQQMCIFDLECLSTPKIIRTAAIFYFT